MISTFARMAFLAGLAFGACVSGTVNAQTGAAEIASYMGPDRTARLIEGAKKEGGFTLYSSATTEDMGEIIKAFEKQYGLKVKFWRADSEGILRRAITEARGGRDEFDLIETSGGTMEALTREKLLQPIKSPVLDDISPKAKFAHGAWTGTRFQIQTLAYNTNVVRKEDLPKTWTDLLDPKWKGKLGIELDDADWFAAIVHNLGEEKGLKLWRDIGARNGVSIRKGHTLLANLTASGEVPLALGVYKYKIAQMKKAGAPIDFLDLDPVVVHPVGTGLSAKPPHPHAALLFFDFLLTEGQRIYITQETQPTNMRVRAAPDHAVYIDHAESLDESDKWNRLFKEAFATKR